jgi:hypothetical protein
MIETKKKQKKNSTLQTPEQKKQMRVRGVVAT